jgi:hypothetical protein
LFLLAAKLGRTLLAVLNDDRIHRAGAPLPATERLCIFLAMRLEARR